MGNVFKSVLASARAILQSKTVTAGTDPLTISPDSGYDGMSQVTVNPTPTETATVTPTTSQQTVYPTSLDAHLSEVTVNAIPGEYVIPTSITPSNSSPVSMASGSAYKPSSAGYAIASYDTLTPSNTSPQSVSSGGIYKASAGGYAISSYSSTSKSPSADGTYFSSGWNRMTASGYAYSSQPSVCKVGSYTPSTSSSVTIDCGFKPKYLCIWGNKSGATTLSYLYIYDERRDTTTFLMAYNGSAPARQNLPNTTAYYLGEITNTGFVMNKYSSSSWAGTHYYFAIG